MTELFNGELKGTRLLRVTCDCRKDERKRYTVTLLPSITPSFFVGECPACHKKHAQRTA